MRCLPGCSGCDKPSPGPSAWAVILRCRAGQQNEGRLCPPRQREYGRPDTGPPLCKGGTAWQSHARGDCEAGGMIQLVFYCRVRRLAVNPSVGVRRQLPLHKGAVFAFLHRACRARERSMGAASRCLPGAGAQYGRPGTGPEALRSPPLCKGGTAWRSHARGDCEADCIILLGCLPSAGAQYGCSVTLLAGRGSAIWVQRHAACPARERSMAVRPPDRPDTGPPLYKGGTAWRSHAGGIVKRIASFCLAVLPSAGAQYGRPATGPSGHRSPPCAKGGQHGAAMQGGL